MEMTIYPNYFVNQQGDVFSTKKGDIKKLKPGRTDGYLQVWISKNINEAKGIYVHRLVAETFIPNPENKSDVNHKNGIKTDNRVENLEWATRGENMGHAYAVGLCKRKLTKEEVLEIRQLYSQRKYNKTNQTKLAEMYGVLQPQISYIINNKQWKYI